MAKAKAGGLGEYTITEEDAARLNNTVSVGDTYPFLLVSEDEDGNVVGHLFLPHVVTSHSFKRESKEDKEGGEDS